MEKYLKALFKKAKLNEPTISTILGALVIITVGALIFNYFKTGVKQENGQQALLEEVQELSLKEAEGQQLVLGTDKNKYIVQEGDSLWKISEKVYKTGYNWTDIAKKNNLYDPNHLEAGQELEIPEVQVIDEKILANTETISPVPGENSQTITGDTYIVKQGDFLWEIAIKAYQDGYKWPEIAKVNNLVNPDILEIGQELKLPR
ncbi:hypothetical protein COT75_00120 [Candidatus Beckwithbacteria bacterium CG10_big_fil_rev_8_21_14_0_10_34_10]|uniref:LysM domain-containing protein n=1 Tax=Candidatus Beckwithbacteria bacterium CG10_big_fil_rev_8_21_14_0_10_34_10 TaxID=1974495 RepID=A0A2H0WCD9_9BACT|nr:MAG: hypothetical protein COT75_00120 [Candidatus Beckwithbacteria bacterium CG10_big_fil_rev_8_21_14_0_10_34_10]